MKAIKITDDVIEQANQDSEFLTLAKATDSNSILRGKGVLHSKIMQLTFAKMIGGEALDMPYLVKKGGVVYQVKTKTTTVPFVDEDYDASVWEKDTRFDYAILVFARIMVTKDHEVSPKKLGWFLGYEPKSNYLATAIKSTKGTYDESNDFTERATCWKKPYKSLRPMSDILPQTGHGAGTWTQGVLPF